jgi:hypothetical protein
VESLSTLLLGLDGSQSCLCHVDRGSPVLSSERGFLFFTLRNMDPELSEPTPAIGVQLTLL